MKLNQITIGGKLFIEVDADPSIAGLVSPIGSMAIMNDGGVGKVFLKVSAANTAWSAISSGAIDLSPYLKKDGSVALTGTLVPDSNVNQSLGTAANRFLSVHAFRFLGGSTGNTFQITDNNGSMELGVLGSNKSILLVPSGTGSVDVASKKITSLAMPVDPTDAASKAYVDLVALGLSPKRSVRVASTANIDIASALINGAVIDGITLVTGDRVLLKDQTLPAQNGIYIVAASGAAVRSQDMDALTPIDEFNGAWVPVQVGTVNKAKVFVQYGTVNTVGTDAVNFEFYNPLAELIGGDMIFVSGSTISVDLALDAGLESSDPGNATGKLRVKLNGATLDRSASGLKVADLGISNAQIATAAQIDYSKLADLTADRALISSNLGKVSVSAVTATQLGYLSTATSDIQVQLDSKWKLASSAANLNTSAAESFFGTFSGDFNVSMYRNNVKMMAFESDSVALYKNKLAYKGAGAFTLESNSGAIQVLSSSQVYLAVGLNSIQLGSTISLGALAGVAVSTKEFSKAIREDANGYACVDIKESSNLASPADGDTTASVQQLIQATGKPKLIMVDIFYRNAEGVTSVFQKHIHLDVNRAIVLVQDSFTSNPSEIAVAVSMLTGSLKLDFSALTGTAKNIKVLYTDKQGF